MRWILTGLVFALMAWDKDRAQRRHEAEERRKWGSCGWCGEVLDPWVIHSWKCPTRWAEGHPGR